MCVPNGQRYIVTWVQVHMYMHCRTIRRNETRLAMPHDSCGRFYESTASHRHAQTGKTQTCPLEVVGAAAATSSLYTTGGIAGPSTFCYSCSATFQCLELGRALAGCLLQVTGGGGSTAMHRAGYRASGRESFGCSSHAGVCTLFCRRRARCALAALVRGGGGREEGGAARGTGIQGRCV